MGCAGQKMEPRQMAALLDSALRTTCPLTHLDAAVMAFKAIGRHADSVTTAWVGCLYAEGEIEILMSLRAAWLRGEKASPAEAARRAMEGSCFAKNRPHPLVEDKDWV